MTDTKCYICGHALEEHAPYVVWHTGWDGCEECDRDYERGVSLLDRLAKACLEHGDVLDDWHTVTDARKVGERLRKG